MSFKTKTILLLILLSLLPYIITMALVGYVYRRDLEQDVMRDMENQLSVTIDRIDQNLQILRNDLQFIASLDIIDDVLSGDIDLRILAVLNRKKTDLQLEGDLYVTDSEGIIIAATDALSIGTAYQQPTFMKFPLYSSFGEDQIGELLVRYDDSNLTRYFPLNSSLEFSLAGSGEPAMQTASNAAMLVLSAPLNIRPDIVVRVQQSRDLAFASLNRLNRSLLLALVIGTLVIASIALLAANYILQPILLLAATAREVTDTQDYSRQVALQRNDEIGQLAIAFNYMINGMQAMIQRVKEESENRMKLVQEKNRAEMLQSLSNKLAKYLSPQIYESIFSGETDVKLGSSRKKLTIFFSDIVDFTSTTDQMESEDLTQLLNQYLQEMTDIALRFGATIDKYIGDAVMIFFGDPHSQGVKEDARLCVEMAVAMQRRVSELHDEWQKAGYSKAFSIRVGIHTGFCTVGNFGTESRMDYTIIGSSVNLASRIEHNAEPGSIYISQDTWLLVKDQFSCMPVSTVSLKGLQQPVQLYKVLSDDMKDRTTLVEYNGFRLEYQPDKLSASDRDRLRELLAGLQQSGEDGNGQR